MGSFTTFVTTLLSHVFNRPSNLSMKNWSSWFPLSMTKCTLPNTSPPSSSPAVTRRTTIPTPVEWGMSCLYSISPISGLEISQYDLDDSFQKISLNYQLFLLFLIIRKKLCFQLFLKTELLYRVITLVLCIRRISTIANYAAL